MEKKPNIKILVACHKADPAIRQDDIYMPIQVGKALHPELDLGFQGDDTGDNISEKNGSYCELTAMYWGWKNLPKDVDIVGLAHYRRYLDIDMRNILKRINKYDLIIPSPSVVPCTVAKELAYWTSIEDVYILVDILRARFKGYRKLIDRFFFQSNKFYRLNMFVMKVENYHEYSKFLFDILEEMECKMKPYNHSRQSRTIGYIGEILLGLWIELCDKKVYTVNVQGTDDVTLRHKFARIRNRVAFWITRPRHVLADLPVVTGLNTDGYKLETF